METGNGPSDQGIERSPSKNINLNTGVYFIRHVTEEDSIDRIGGGSSDDLASGSLPRGAGGSGRGGPTAAFFRIWLSLRKTKGDVNHDQDGLNELLRMKVKVNGSLSPSAPSVIDDLVGSLGGMAPIGILPVSMFGNTYT